MTFQWSNAYPTVRIPLFARNVVSTSQPLAAQAGLRMLLKGGTRLLVLLVVVTGFLILQNALGIAAAIGLDMNPLFGLLAGSVTMSGGHGTGAAYGKLFGEVSNLQGAVEVAMAAATFGLVMGGIVGGPVAERLINRHNLRGSGASGPQPELTAPGELGPEDFIKGANGTFLNDRGRKAFWEAWFRRCDMEVRHPEFEYKMAYRRMLEVQARQLWRFVRGEAAAYHGFTTR